MMGKKGKKSGNWAMFWIVAIVIVGVVALAMIFSNPASTGNQGLVTGDGTTTQVVKTESDCPDDGQTTVTLDIQNTLNEASAETFDAEVTFIGDDGSKVTGTDGTAGSYNLNCDAAYELIVESADGNAGDNSKITSVLEGVGATLTNDGTVTFTAQKNVYNLRVAVAQHGVLEFKAYDNDAAGWMCDSDASCSLYELDGVSFESTTNGTAKALTNVGDYLDVTISVRTNETDTEFCDNYCYFAVEAPVTEYDEPTVRFEGALLSDIKAGGLNAYESKQLSNYEYVYKYEGTIENLAKKLDFYIEANANPSTDPQIDFLAAGKVDSINGVDILTSTAQDDSSATTVYAIQDLTFDIS